GAWWLLHAAPLDISGMCADIAALDGSAVWVLADHGPASRVGSQLSDDLGGEDPATPAGWRVPPDQLGGGRLLRKARADRTHDLASSPSSSFWFSDSSLGRSRR